MEIRPLNQQEILPALHLVWEVFVTEVAPGYTPEGVAEFQKFIKYENIIQKWQRGEIFFFGALEGEELCGTIAYQPDGHICLFYVRKERQGQGIGRLLFQAVYNDCIYRLKVSRITVNAAPGAVPKYLHMGMRQTLEEQIVNGVRYVPLELNLYAQASTKKKSKKKTVIVVCVIAVIAVIVLIVAGVFVYRSVQNKTEQGEGRGDSWQEESRNPENGQDDAQGTEDEELGGSAAIPEYIAEGLSYEIEEETYNFSDEEKQSMVIEFQVTYPKLTGMKDEKTQETVNEILKETAMETVDRIYENPSEEIKERVIGESSPVLVDYGEYKVCYASEEFISVVYDDYSYQGSQEAYVQHLRTCNISLKDGTVYEVKDIVEIRSGFIQEWAEVMRSEAGNDQFLSELSEHQMKKSLEGDSLDGVYVVNFFVDADGIEIGYDLNYPEDDENDLGYVWVTAPFSWEEIQEYAADSTFWEETDHK